MCAFSTNSAIRAISFSPAKFGVHHWTYHIIWWLQDFLCAEYLVCADNLVLVKRTKQFLEYKSRKGFKVTLTSSNPKSPVSVLAKSAAKFFMSRIKAFSQDTYHLHALLAKTKIELLIKLYQAFRVTWGQSENESPYLLTKLSFTKWWDR